MSSVETDHEVSFGGSSAPTSITLWSCGIFRINGPTRLPARPPNQDSEGAAAERGQVVLRRGEVTPQGFPGEHPRREPGLLEASREGKLFSWGTIASRSPCPLQKHWPSAGTTSRKRREEKPGRRNPPYHRKSWRSFPQSRVYKIPAANLSKETRRHRARGCCVHPTSHLAASPRVPSSTVITTMRPEVAFNPAGVTLWGGTGQPGRSPGG